MKTSANPLLKVFVGIGGLFTLVNWSMPAKAQITSYTLESVRYCQGLYQQIVHNPQRVSYSRSQVNLCGQILNDYQNKQIQSLHIPDIIRQGDCSVQRSLDGKTAAPCQYNPFSSR